MAVNTLAANAKPSDAALVAIVKSGHGTHQTAAINELLKRYRPIRMNLRQKYNGRGRFTLLDATGIEQMAVWQASKRYDPVQRWGPWYSRTLEYIWYQAWWEHRQRNTQKLVSLDAQNESASYDFLESRSWMDTIQSDYVDHAVDEDETTEAKRLWKTLKHRFTAVELKSWLLIDIHGLSHANAAKLLGLTSKHIDNSVTRARVKYQEWRLEQIELQHQSIA